MRILFLVTGNGSRSNFVNGELMRYGEAGLSGTDTSAILVAEYLAAQGYDITLAVEKSSEDLIKQREERGFTFTPGEKVNGVVYTYLDLEGIEDSTFDILINCLWYGDYDKLPATITKAVCYWCHLAWVYYLNELKEYAQKHNLRVGYINISKWAEGHHQGNIDFLKEHFSDLETPILPNSMTTDVMQEVLDMKLERKPKKVIFPAQWSRGGDVAFKAVKELGWELDFMSFDYVNLAKGIDKKTLFTELATSDYFIFPQYTNENVFKDVHSCAVGEAIGMGVVVLSYPLGSHEEHYGGHYIKLDFPPGIDMEKMMTERVTHEPKMDYTENIVKIVKFLEDNAHIKDYIREKGTPYVLENFNINKIGPKWMDFLTKLEKEEKNSSIFKNTYYINLDERKDRKEEFLKELEKVNLKNVKRISAVNLTEDENQTITDGGGKTHEDNNRLNAILKSERSCFLSHLSIIRKAKEDNLDYVVIFEDDCVFLNNAKENLVEIKNFIENNQDWDFIYLGLNLLSEVESYNDIFYRLKGHHSGAHSYIVNKRMYDTILKYSLNDYFVIDLLYRDLGLSRVSLCYKTLLTTQKDGFSNIENRNMYYSYYFSNNFKSYTSKNTGIDLSKVGFFYQTSKNYGAVEMNLNQLRKFYPNSPIAVWEDITEECKDVCAQYNVTYNRVHRLPTDDSWHRSQPITEINGGLHYLNRLYTSCMTDLKEADWIMHYEDDVWCSGHINKFPTNEWGGTIRTAWHEELNQYLRDVMGIEGDLFHGACGGALISREAIVKSYLKLQKVNWVEILKRDERVSWYSDYLISFMLINAGYKWTWWENWEQGGYEDFKVYTQPFIHNIKYWYGVDSAQLDDINSQENVKFFIENNNNFNL